MRAWLTSRSRRKRYGWFTLHRVESHYGERTYCGATAIEVKFRTPAEMLDKGEFEPCGSCWSRVSWDEVEGV